MSVTLSPQRWRSDRRRRRPTGTAQTLNELAAYSRWTYYLIHQPELLPSYRRDISQYERIWQGTNERDYRLHPRQQLCRLPWKETNHTSAINMTVENASQGTSDEQRALGLWQDGVQIFRPMRSLRSRLIDVTWRNGMVQSGLRKACSVPTLQSDISLEVVRQCPKADGPSRGIRQC